MESAWCCFPSRFLYLSSARKDNAQATTKISKNEIRTMEGRNEDKAVSANPLHQRLDSSVRACFAYFYMGWTLL